MKREVLKRTIGAFRDEAGKVRIRVWSPEAEGVEVVLEEGDRLPLQQEQGGYWSVLATLAEGATYKISKDGAEPLPDPASVCQPEGVHGPSAFIDLPQFRWSEKHWQNHSLSQYIIYELHVGTFTEEGSFTAIIGKLDHLVELGVTAIEIMPVAQFPGQRNWGYDGVFPFAVQDSYGGARGLQQLVDACHTRGIAVILDVVYNHLGPEGNYLGAFGPYFTEKYKTPWGGALNFDDEWCGGVRDYFVQNALMWFRDFHIDALRLDAVHAIKDFSAIHILQEIRSAIDELMMQTGRKHYLVVELDLNDTRFIDPVARRGFGMDAQWIDEFHHALRVTAGGDRTGYYSDFLGLEHLAKSYRDAYVYDGQYSPHRKRNFGVPARENGGEQFIVFSQNHDQVGNRMKGERSSVLHSFEMQKLMAGAVLVSPFLPMLFMGEEWSEPAPFLYFVSHTDKELADAVRKGRREEFAAFHAEGEAPDPVAEETYLRSKLQWGLRARGPHASMLQFYQDLIRLRKQTSSLYHLNRHQLEVEADKERKLLRLRRWYGNEEVLCFLNFSKEGFSHGLNGSWTLVLDSSAKAYNGPGSEDGIVNAESISIFQKKQN